MAQILGIETSTDVCGVALLENDHLVAETIINRPRIHSERLTAAIDQVLGNGNLSSTAVDALAVSVGPGSYTGLRIGLSAAKGFAFARDLPVIAVPSLEVIAAQVTSCASVGDFICVTRDARKNELYCSIFEILDQSSHDANIDCRLESSVTTYDQLDDLLDTIDIQNLWIAGNVREEAAHTIYRSTRIFEPYGPAPTAYWVGRSAIHRFEAGTFIDLASYEPEYIRPFHTHERKSPFEPASDNS